MQALALNHDHVRHTLEPLGVFRGSRHRRIAVAFVAGGSSLAFIAGRDGTLLWQATRVAAIVVATLVAMRLCEAAPQRRAGYLSFAFGVPAAAVGAGLAPHIVKQGASVTSAAAVVLLLAGGALVVAGVTLAARGRGLVVRTGGRVVAVVIAAIVVWLVGPAVAATNVPRPPIGRSPGAVGLAYESVALTTSDGVRLAAWYVPSTNRAAVVLLHGAGSTRSSVLDEAAVLAAHGYGLLLVDARGHGESGGRAMDFGWQGDADIDAAIRFLASRTDVDDRRIGIVGKSMGGEAAIGASGSNPTIRAVVAEGATARSAADEAWLSDDYGLRGHIQEQLERFQDVVTDALTSASVPLSSREAVAASGATRYLLIAAGSVRDEARAASHVARAARSRVTTWTVPGSDHTDGLRTRPAEWERRVIRFLDESLPVDR